MCQPNNPAASLLVLPPVPFPLYLALPAKNSTGYPILYLCNLAGLVVAPEDCNTAAVSHLNTESSICNRKLLLVCPVKRWYIFHNTIIRRRQCCGAKTSRRLCAPCAAKLIGGSVKPKRVGGFVEPKESKTRRFCGIKTIRRCCGAITSPSILFCFGQTFLPNEAPTVG